MIYFRDRDAVGKCIVCCGPIYYDELPTYCPDCRRIVQVIQLGRSAGPLPIDHRDTPGDREARLLLYAQRAASELPLFD